jgi:hypothetical protein
MVTREMLDIHIYSRACDLPIICTIVIDALNSESGDPMYDVSIDILTEAIGHRRAKPFALVDVVHAKVVNIKQWNWATGAAVKFYR